MDKAVTDIDAADFNRRLMEARVEDLEFFDLGFFDDPAVICGVKCRPITLEMLRDLYLAQSPFVCAGSPDAVDAFVALWYLSKGYRPWKRVFRPIYYLAWRKKSYQRIVDGIRSHIADALRDAPKGKADNTRRPATSWLASVIHRVASRYHWSETKIMAMPARRVWQYLRLIDIEDAAKAGKERTYLGGKYDQVMSEYLQWINRRNKEAQDG